jgi:hypothetical protein
MQWDLLAWMLACAAAGLFLWDRLFAPKLGARWAAILVGIALLPLVPALRADRVLGPFDTNVPLRPWVSRDLPGYRPRVGLLNDITLQIAPWQVEARRQMLSGRVPLLNPYSGSGQALLGNGQSAPFSPVSLAALPFSPERAQALRAFLKALLALAGAFLAARQWSARPAFALVAAVTCAYGGSLAVWRLFPIGEVLAFFPFAFLASEKILAEGARMRSCALLSLALAAMILAGHPETGLAAGCALAGRWLWAAAGAWRRRDRRIPGAFQGIFAAVLLALVGTAFFTLPLGESILRSEKLARHAGDGEKRVEASARLGGLIGLGVPGSFGTPQRSAEAGPAPIPWLAEGATGLPVLMLALAGLFLPGARRETETYLWALTPVAYALHLDPLGLASRLFSLPGLAAIDLRYFAYLGGFGLSLLAAFSLERWMAEPSVRRRLAVAAGAGALATLWILGGQQAVTAFWRARGALAGLPPGVLAESGRHTAVALAAAALTLLGLAVARRRPLAAGCLIALVGLGQLLDAFGGYNPVIPAAYAYPPVPLLDRIAREPGPFRVAGTRGVFVANASTFYGIADIRTHDPTESSRYVDWLTEMLDFDRAKYKKQYPRPKPEHLPYLRLLGTRFLLSGADLRLDPPWMDRGLFRETRLWELPFAVRWAFFPANVVPAGSAAEARAAIRNLGNPYRLASIELGSAGEARRPNGAARVDRVRVGTGDLEASVAVGADAWLVVSQAAIPGWRAWADGRPARLAVADGTLLAVEVPAGTSRVRLVYSPASWRLGRWLLLLALLGAYPALRWGSRRVSISDGLG